MKKIRLLALLWIILISGTLAWCWWDKENNNGDFIIEDITWENEGAINYNDTLVDLTSQCIELENSIWNTYDDNESTSEDIIAAINNTVNECANVNEKINELWDREWDSSLKDAVAMIIEKEIAYYIKFSELLPYLDKEELTDEEKESYNTIYSELETLDEELTNANENLSSIQENFAKNHGFELENPNEDEEISE